MQAQAEGLTLGRSSFRQSGFLNVGMVRPYKAGVWRDGKHVHLGYFATAEKAKFEPFVLLPL